MTLTKKSIKKFQNSLKIVKNNIGPCTWRPNSFIDTNLIHNFYINYIKLSSSTCFERHPLLFRRSMMLIVHVCSLWYSHSVKVNYFFIVLGICYHFVKKETTMCGCIALCAIQLWAIQPHIVFSFLTKL